ncbi:radical SAM protein [Sinorhizobium medicae]|nr:radical SAM protein [Sinorhizobium medicae]
MAKVRLSTSPHIRHGAVLEHDFRPANSLMYGFAPVGLLSLAAMTRDQTGWTPELFDLNRRIADGTVSLGPDFYDQMAHVLLDGEPDVIGFMTECDSYHHILQLCDRLAARATVKIVLGRPHATAVAHETLGSCSAVDAIVLGEGEQSFVELLQAYERFDPGPVKGVVRRGPDGVIVDGGAGSLISDLDDLPIPAYDMYLPDPGEEIFLEVGRGCPFQCEFCSTAPFWKRRHRVKSPDRILAEIGWITELYGPRRIHFTHDLFTTDRKWVESLCRALIESGSTTPWTCSARTDLVDDHLLASMAQAGCSAIYFGIESGSERVLNAIDKKVGLGRSLWALERCKAHGISPNAGFILGFPQDDVLSARETFDAYVRSIELGCRPAHIFGFCPFTASSMFSSLGELKPTNHFVDLPLGSVIDAANREYISSNPNLFASYYRPAASGLWALGPGWIEGVDEFSPLVEAVTWPALVLAQIKGGMFEVYSAWIDWIAGANRTRGAAPSRLWYGTPGHFCQFLEHELRAGTTQLAAAASEVAMVIGVGFRLAGRNAFPRPSAITMASHRTIRTPVKFGLRTQVKSGNIANIASVGHDLTEALAWRSGEPIRTPPRIPLHLVWQISESGDVALMVVDEAIHELLSNVASGPLTAAELMAQWSREPSLARLAHLDAVTTCIDAAAKAGFVEVS